MDPFRNGAAGMARSASPIGRSLNRSSAELFRPEDFAELTTITASRYRARASRPSAALSVASQLLVDAAATPPLRGGEYSTCDIQNRRKGMLSMLAFLMMMSEQPIPPVQAGTAAFYIATYIDL